jgi:hypothetical protein
LVLLELLHDDDDLDSAGAVDDVFDERDYFRTISYLLDGLAVKLIGRDDTLNHLDRSPAGRSERASCARILRAAQALIAELDAYHQAGYAPALPVIEAGLEKGRA